jgi:hypothetical protein
MTNESTNNRRRPVRNFIILPGIQTRFIVQFAAVLVVTSFLTVVAIVMSYYFKSGDGYFYFMSNDLNKPLEQHNLLTTILPTLVAVELISVLVALYIGLFASRKIAVPLYRIRLWAKQVREGNLDYKLSFREKNEYVELEQVCNEVSMNMKFDLTDMKNKLNALETEVHNGSPQAQVLANIQKIKEITAKYLK